MKDIVEALLLPRIDYVAIVVPFDINETTPFRNYCNLAASLYAQQVVQAHIHGLLVLAYWPLEMRPRGPACVTPA